MKTAVFTSKGRTQISDFAKLPRKAAIRKDRTIPRDEQTEYKGAPITIASVKSWFLNIQ